MKLQKTIQQADAKTINRFLNGYSLFLLCTFLQCAVFISPVRAIIFDRRSSPELQTSWFVYPLAGKIPGVQSFYGMGATIAAIGGSESDVTLIKLKGEAEHFDNDDFEIDLLMIFDVSLYTKHITLSYFRTDIRNGALPENERGIDSDPDNRIYLLGSTVHASGGEISLNFLDNQFELYYAFVQSSVKPYGVVDNDGNFYADQDSNLNKSPQGYRYGVYIDDTDNRRDPRVGYRIQFERWGIPAATDEHSQFYQDDINYTAFIPLLSDHSGVLVLNYFQSSATVIREGTVDASDYKCDEAIQPGCQAVFDRLYQNKLDTATKGKATSLGGTNRLRGYPTNRFYDSHMGFYGIECRWYMLESQNAFNYIIEKGVFAGIQLALFYEEGTVAPEFSELWDETRNSYGLGMRIIMNTTIVRADYGISDEGSEFTFFVGYPF